MCAKKPATHDYVLHLYELHLLVLSGFPVDADSLPYQTWLDLGQLRQAINAKMRVLKV